MRYHINIHLRKWLEKTKGVWLPEKMVVQVNAGKMVVQGEGCQSLLPQLHKNHN